MKKIICGIKEEKEIKLLQEAGCNIILLADDQHATRFPAYFNREQLTKCIEECHALGLEVMIGVNRIYQDEEIASLDAYMSYLKSMNVDYYYFNDPGVYMLAKKIGVQDRLVYNPDTLCTNSYDINVWLKQGIYGCVIAKELTLAQMMEIAAKTTHSMVMLHGYLNMSYSKRRLLQNYMDEIESDLDLDGRFDLKLQEATREDLMPVYQDKQGTCIYTPYIQTSFEEFLALGQSGIEYFIIERMFVPFALVYDAIKTYRMIEQGGDARQLNQEYASKYQDYPLSTGYMYQKTSMVK
ncbi:MAG: U32 family peptidase [Erysipelotrichaceae bacterium]|nr:U32 family peptidase [Erysipelotrichaceae bacterium]